MSPILVKIILRSESDFTKIEKKKKKKQYQLFLRLKGRSQFVIIAKKKKKKKGVKCAIILGRKLLKIL